tara:strand:+ start:127958 stop:128656 length:699 start_codon:yes stop_codon:yes gene_type:complete
MKLWISIALFSFFFLTNSGFAASSKVKKSNGIFSGRISRINEKASLLRLKVDFANMKYLNKKDKVEFWDERGSDIRCKAYIIGKSNNYLLMKVPEFDYCKRFIFISEGAYVQLFSQDLINNLSMGKELVDILLKKKMAISSKLLRNKKSLDSHIERVNAINLRYKVLRDKLEAEWREELASLEEDRLTSFRNHKDLEGQLLEIDDKLEKYRIEDKNLKEDRWALDPRLYFSK